jgi:hypothetical protein
MIYREPQFDDLRADKAQQANAAAAERKCGTCRFFAVKPTEAMAKATTASTMLNPARDRIMPDLRRQRRRPPRLRTGQAGSLSARP